jgi:predicted nucleic acid-binding protein
LIRYLIDSSALWRVLRQREMGRAWAEVIAAGAIGSCHPQRVEFRRSARNLTEYEQMTDMFHTLYPDVTVPKGVWSWIDAAQYRLLRHEAHRALAVADLLICATAAHHGLVVLHDDGDFATAAKHLTDLRERSIHHTPAPG